MYCQRRIGRVIGHCLREHGIERAVLEREHTHVRDLDARGAE
jgi:hypothetical protein